MSAKKLAVFSGFFLAYAFFLTGLNRIPVPTVDGAVRASIARNIVQTGQWYPLQYQGETIVDHPPLFVWTIAASFKAFGINDFAANLPMRLAAFLLVLVVILIALESAMTAGPALASAVILCLTRDFVLSSVRGYIEPLLELFVYLAVLFVLKTNRSQRPHHCGVFAAIFVFLAALSKGPPALLPAMLCFLFLFANFRIPLRSRLSSSAAFLGTLSICCALTAIWIKRHHFEPYFSTYIHQQVLGSALLGRGGAQEFEPTYFLKILRQYYWPWSLFLLWALFRIVISQKDRTFENLLFALLGFGFVTGFSVVRWKFWYYIAPAYPAFALLICSILRNRFILSWTNHPIFYRSVVFLSIGWILVASAYPVQLHHERVPEVMAFKDTIRNSSMSGPVWYVQGVVDHNLIGTSGQWYFERKVQKVTDEHAWASHDLKSPSWIITGSEFFKNCRTSWCQRSIPIQKYAKSDLLFFR